MKPFSYKFSLPAVLEVIKGSGRPDSGQLKRRAGSRPRQGGAIVASSGASGAQSDMERSERAGKNAALRKGLIRCARA
jgi:hypothetical protein